MKFTIEFDANQLNVLAQALSELPFKLAAPLIGHIDAQVKAQQQPAPTPPTQQPLDNAGAASE